MTRDDPSRLGEVEQWVLLAVLRLGEESYAVPIRELIEREAGVLLPRGSIYVTLDRLEAKGFVGSHFGEPTAVQGGKARRLFRALPAGISALRDAQRAVRRLSTGTVLARK